MTMASLLRGSARRSSGLSLGRSNLGTRASFLPPLAISPRTISSCTKESSPPPRWPASRQSLPPRSARRSSLLRSLRTTTSRQSRRPLEQLVGALRRVNPYLGRGVEELLYRLDVILLWSLAIFFITHLVAIHIFEIRLSEGASMLPTIHWTNDWVVIIRLPFLKLLTDVFGSGQQHQQQHSQASGSGSLPFKKDHSKSDRCFGLPLALGDIVVSVSPSDPDKHVCKRIVGLPGDCILIDPRTPEPSSSEYLVESSADTSDPNDASAAIAINRGQSPTMAAADSGQGYITVPPGYVFLCGDNLNNSTDSRQYGPVPMGLIRGKILAKCWPQQRWLHGDHVEMLPMREEGTVQER